MSRVRDVEAQARSIADDTVNQLTGLVALVNNSVDAATCAAIVGKLRADLSSIDWTRGAWDDRSEGSAELST